MPVSCLFSTSMILALKRMEFLAFAGKSTLIKCLGGNLPLWNGQKKLGDGVKISYFSQDLAQVGVTCS